jgi:hypothetical protein
MKTSTPPKPNFASFSATTRTTPELLSIFGYMLADRDVRLDEALKLIPRALELEPGNGAYLDSLGGVYFYATAGKTRDAITQGQTSLKEWEKAASADTDPQEVTKVTKKLEDARVRVAKEGKPEQQR